MYSQNFTSTSHESKPTVRTYPNRQAIIDMTCRQNSLIKGCGVGLKDTDKPEHVQSNKDKDENLLMLILTLMLTLDGESDKIIYLLTALTMFIDIKF